MQYFLGRFKEAETIYFKILEIDPSYAYANGNLAILYWLQLNSLDIAQYHADLARPYITEIEKLLLDAAKSLATNFPKNAWEALNTALSVDGEKIWNSYAGWHCILRYAVSRGYGIKFKEWMEAAGYPDRYAPLYWAFLALLEGDAILLNVNPEVRRTAERIYRGLVIGQKPKPNKKKGGRVRAST